MDRRYLLKTLGAVGLSMSSTTGMARTINTISRSKSEIYEWRIYSLIEGKQTEFDAFLSKIFIPAFHRLGVRSGAFRPIESDTKRYVLFVYDSLDDFKRIHQETLSDKTFCSESRPFYDQSASNPVYSNFETFLCESESIHKFPLLKMPPSSRSVFELRIYHSPNEDANRRKLAMFNNDEIEVFNTVGIKPVCFGNIMAGPSMPALMYLTWHESLEKRSTLWKKFLSSEGWLRIKNEPQYAYTATKNLKILLYPMEYSQI